MSLMIICPNCGVENEPGAKHCKACDALLATSQEGDQEVSDSSAEDIFPMHPSEEQDLPDLLHSLKQDGEITTDGQVVDDAENRDADESELQHEENSPENEVPEWLQRIRDRARKEPDAAGEITQKLSAAQESLTKSESEDQEDNFASWIHSLRGETADEPPEKSPEMQDHPQQSEGRGEATPEWLSKIRKVKGPASEENQNQGSDFAHKKGDSLLQWLVALEEGKETVQPVTRETQEIEKTKDLEGKQAELDAKDETSEETQKIPVLKLQREKKPVLDASREEQLQANLFSSIVVDERAERPLREPQREKTPWAVRLIASLVLIGVLSAALFGGWPGEGFGSGFSIENTGMRSAISDLPEEASILVVADYQAGFSQEVHSVARPILLNAITPEMEIALIASQPSGMLLSRRLLAGLSGEGDFMINDLGYIPSPSVGAYAIADYQMGERRGALPAEGLPGTLDGVFILADSYESARFWVEQLSVRMPDTPLFLLVTAKAGPLLTPYLDSGQVSGLIAGIVEMDQFSDDIEGGLEINLSAAYQLGTLLLAVMILIGAILTGRPEKDKKEGGDNEYE
ncbi:MAG: hypothetical protein ACOCYU_02520 [Brevefilum sp.]